MEFLFDLFGEFILQIVFEAIASLFSHLTSDWKPKVSIKESSPLLTAIGHAAAGVAAGGVSLLLFPNFLLRSEMLRVANLVLTPLLAGFAMMQIGRWRERHDAPIVPLNKFAYAFLFALGMATVRFIFAK